MARKPALGCLPNYAAVGAVGVGATSEVATMPASNLTDRRPSKRWRAKNPWPNNTIVQFSRVFASGMASDYFALVGANLRPGTGRYRFIGISPSVGSPFFEELPPTSLDSSTNLTGTYTDVDEAPDSAPDANKINATAPGACMARFGFGTPSDAPRTGDDYNFVGIYAKATDLSDPNSCTVQASLYEGGVLVKNLGTKVVRSTAGHWLFFWWDGADLGTADGSALQIQLDFSHLVDVYTVRVGIEGATLLSGVTDFDDGWKTWPLVTLTGGPTFQPQVDDRTAMPRYYPSSDVNSIFVYLLLADDQCPLTAPTEGILEPFPRVPDGFIQAGVAVATKMVVPSKGAKYGPAARIDDPSPVAFTGGHQLLTARQRKPRSVYLDAAGLTEEEWLFLMHYLDDRKGTTDPVIVEPDPDNANVTRQLALYARVKDSGDFARMATSTPLYGRGYVFEEFF